MAVLSDTEILARMAKGDLVLGGDTARATECSYSFVSGSAFIPGETTGPIIFPGSAGNSEVTVSPGQMIWIRTLERVKIPDSFVGFWWQTNSLSRKGLMLVNMSMVEPGYEGDLACLFVNFAKSTVVISATTPIAKMVFMPIQGLVGTPFAGDVSRQRYDDALRQLAINQPKSFLQIAELSTELGDAKNLALRDIEKTAQAAAAQVKSDATAAKTDAVADFKKDIPAAIRSSFAWALGAFVILSLTTVVVEYLKGQLFPDVKAIARSEADTVLKERIMIQGETKSSDVEAILERLLAIDARLKSIEKTK
ncbi:dCTP deaminase [Agrobacterium rubi]|uniref:dUTPase-like domain-containing protein n=1 Tax=Agrobacterium rubi TaxID=28099 RepID=A0AAE7R811_9HYPH|nr:hypothetical protein [Agrobacterium rubi]NTE89576.1 hypothetical protein [Agrobacterium rubi]NTF05712.1 hypothetical protein [Agrobacterium rubi]NTF39712.1 hypothetical protein [Agrobacterium rubi]QTG03510.1 hypothetical protein G6M88_23910 [Agrobacterium rubi]